MTEKILQSYNSDNDNTDHDVVTRDNYDDDGGEGGVHHKVWAEAGGQERPVEHPLHREERLHAPGGQHDGVGILQ